MAWSDNFFYQLTRVPLYTTMTLGFSFRHEGGHNIPRKGPVLLISNHESFLDPPMIGIVTTRPLHYLARKTLFKPGIADWVLRHLNAVPVDQEGVAKEGLKSIINLLHEGKAVVVFPEGERTWKGNIQPLKPGIQLVIRKTRCPIIPVGIAGAYTALPRTEKYPHFSPFFMPATDGAIAIAIGKPMDPTPYIDMDREKMLLELHGAISKMKERAQHIRKKW
jgi:1-acyl-sn-glycerol-3-phosphate acyltransferase